MNHFKTKHYKLLTLAFLLLFLATATNVFSQARKTINFDNNWQ